jgi:hypothetical protein
MQICEYVKKTLLEMGFMGFRHLPEADLDCRCVRMVDGDAGAAPLLAQQAQQQQLAPHILEIRLRIVG